MIRLRSKATAAQAGTATSYTANQLNQYTAITGMSSPIHDDDGNMTIMPSTTGSWAIQWNAENRMTVAESDTVKLEFTYDYMGRRVEKKVYTRPTIADIWSLTSDLRYIYDGWNLIAELASTPTPPYTLTPTRTYTWGLDLSQTTQGAGGVGGLLSVSDLGSPTSDIWYATYDANGNVSEYLDATGASVAHYEYSPFGRTTVATGSHSDIFKHRFSTKYLDEHGLYYYGRRCYNPEIGRWINRDPIGEMGDFIPIFLCKMPP
ncbi:MAG: RHS repeat-associated core domain-containing protein [Lentisphaeria bacterium]|nr:RHS repeat-associated core domain-containing protein [Lentisphaeria bacterium]